jgi:uncharacterized damage-inducible protein DinB
MAAPETIETLLDRIQTSRADFDAAIARLTEEQFTAASADGGWSAKDVLAHVASWELSSIALLHHEPRHAAMGLEADTSSMDIDTINQRLYELHRDRPPGEVLSMAHEAHERAVAVISSLEDSDLRRPFRDFSDEDLPDRDDPVVNWIAADTYEHYEEHLPAIRAQASRE